MHTESSDTDKDNVNNRIPSPGSLSSLNSVKQPLEWDSGADVGYRCNSNSVENRSLPDDGKARMTLNWNIQTPVANSTPNTLKAVEINISKSDTTKDMSNISKILSVNSDTRNDVHKNIKFTTKRLSKSLDHLDNFNIYASGNVNKSFVRKTYKNTEILKNNINCSSSSASTIIQIPSSKSDKISDKYRVIQYSNDMLEVSKQEFVIHKDNVLNLNGLSIECNDKDKMTNRKCRGNGKSISEKHSNICIPLKERGANTTILQQELKGSSNTTDNINTSECFSGSDSFKYVSGAVYENRSLKQCSPIDNALPKKKNSNSNSETIISSLSDVGTNDSNVNRGVELITRYISELNTLKKKKIQRKIGKILINENSAVSAHKACGPSEPIQYDREMSSSHLSENNFRHPDDLKKYLAKESEIQIMWIKSGTDYLNNLKKLFKSQEELRKLIINNRNNQSEPTSRLQSKTASSVSDESNGMKTTKSNITKTTEPNNIRSVDSKTASSQTNSSLLLTRPHKETHSYTKIADNLGSHKCHLSELSSYLSSCELTSSTYVKPMPPAKMTLNRKRKEERNRSNRREIINMNNVQVGGSVVCRCCRKVIRNPICVNCEQSCKPSMSYTISFTSRSSTEKQKFRKTPAKKTESAECNQSEIPAAAPKVQNYPWMGKSSQDYLVPNRPEYIKSSKLKKTCLTAKKTESAECNQSEIPTVASKVQNYPWMGKSLQDYLVQNRPEYVQCAQIRQKCLKEIAYLRDLRSKTKRELIDLLDNSDEDIANCVKRIMPPPVLSTVRIFDRKSMKKKTEETYRRLPEVLENEREKNKEKTYQTNRIMAKIFTKKLQRKVLKGQINLSNSASVISS